MSNSVNIDQIVLVHDRVEARGGASGLARLAAFRYAARGHKVTFINGEGDDAELAAAGVTCIGLGQDGLLNAGALTAFRNGFHNSAAVTLLSKWIEENDTPRTVYHLHNWAQILSPGVYGALRPVESRTVVSCHDFFNACPNGGFLHFGKGEVCNKTPLSAGCWMSQCDRRSPVHKYWRMARHMRLNAEARFATSKMAFVTLHEGMAEMMKASGFPASNMQTIRNPSDAYTSERIDAAANEAFLYIGRFKREKGHDIALDATAKAGVPIIMVGEGDGEAELIAKYPHADFVGFHDRTGLAHHASRARAIIVPSRLREPFGLVTTEAAKSGLPVLISDTCMLAPDIARTKAGLAFNADDIDGLAATIKALAGDDGRINEMSHNAFTEGPGLCHTEESWGDAFLDLFKSRLAASELT